MKFSLIYLVGIFIWCPIQAQQGMQSIRGEIKDKESEQILSFVSVGLYKDTSLVQSAQSDSYGRFELKEILPGRYILKTFLTGYKSALMNDVIVNSGRETILTVWMYEEPMHLTEVVVNARTRSNAINEMVLTGGKVFSVEETDRYAGSRGDPARMAACFAGTQSTDDSRNDIVIRGNSPLGVLYRIQDVDIPNPNHFAIPGTTGGAISILNNKMFSSSDFLIGAFPAEYGNCNSGVFDIKLRNGNNEHHEGTVQFGFLGTELSLEGPLSKKASATYLVTYRYSTLRLFEALKIKIGTDAIPNYQDASFKFNFPLSDGSNLALFGIGGTSKIDIILSKFSAPSEELYGENNKDQYFGSSMGMLGAAYTKSYRSGLLVKATLSYLTSAVWEKNFVIYRNMEYKVDSLVRHLGYDFLSGKTALALNLQKKWNARNVMKVGMHVDQMHYDLIDSIYRQSNGTFLNRINANQNTILVQAYTQWKHKLNNALEFNAGVHLQYFSLNKQSVIEPRFSFRWSLDKLHAWSGGIGLHSQMQPYYLYFSKSENANGVYEEQNRNLGFSKSLNSTLAYDYSITDNLRGRIELYYIKLYEIPIDKLNPAFQSYSVLNEGADFGRFFPGKLNNAGTGYNYGVECTLDKSFSSGYYYLFTSSLYQSRYKGNDGVLRNTSFNGNFTLNGLFGKEFSVSERHNKIFSVGAKISYAGGHRYSPPDVEASKKNEELVIIDSLRNSLQFRNYFRLDIKLGFKMNSKKVTHEFGIDLVNILNTKNILTLVYAPDPRISDDNPLKVENQLGFLPLFYYKLDFTLKRN